MVIISPLFQPHRETRSSGRLIPPCRQVLSRVGQTVLTARRGYTGLTSGTSQIEKVNRSDKMFDFAWRTHLRQHGRITASVVARSCAFFVLSDRRVLR